MASGNTMFILRARDALPSISDFATPDEVEEASTPAGITPVLDFDPGTAEHADFEWTVPSHYAGGGLTISAKMGTDNTSIGTLQLDIRVVKISDADVLTADQGRDAATAAAISDTPPATPQNKLNYSGQATLTHANIGSPSAGDKMIVRATRNVATDTNTGDLQCAEIVATET
jgi:hypothetical protein